MTFVLNVAFLLSYACRLFLDTILFFQVGENLLSSSLQNNIFVYVVVVKKIRKGTIYIVRSVRILYAHVCVYYGGGGAIFKIWSSL